MTRHSQYLYIDSLLGAAQNRSFWLRPEKEPYDDVPPRQPGMFFPSYEELCRHLGREGYWVPSQETIHAEIKQAYKLGFAELTIEIYPLPTKMR